MIYHAHCQHCSAKWHVVPPTPPPPFDLRDAISTMEQALCPCCGNDGGKAPVNWKFTFGGGDRDPNYGQVRRKA